MNNQVQVTVESEWGQSERSPVATAMLKVIFPHLTNATPLTEDNAKEFLQFIDELIGRKVNQRLGVFYPGLRINVFSHGLKTGSLELLVNIDIAKYVEGAGTVVTIISLYPTLKQSLKDIAADIHKMGSWLKDACANTFEWISTGVVPPPTSDELAIDKSPTETEAPMTKPLSITDESVDMKELLVNQLAEVQALKRELKKLRRQNIGQKSSSDETKPV